VCLEEVAHYLFSSLYSFLSVYNWPCRKHRNEQGNLTTSAKVSVFRLCLTTQQDTSTQTHVLSYTGVKMSSSISSAQCIQLLVRSAVMFPVIPVSTLIKE